MARKEVVIFLQNLVLQPELQAKLKTFSKSEVLAYAEEAGYKFTEQEFDDTVWGIEIFLANKLGENFDLTFSLWQTMWGKYYLEYIASNVIDSLSKQEIDEFLNQ
jgi:predicted ribosomally synthesized peptide with nif11-like leader